MSIQQQQQPMPIVFLREGTTETKGNQAQRNNITAAKTIAEIVRTSLGPRGMDKMLVNNIGDVTITNDGATILKEIDVQHPAAKMMVEISKATDNEVGDGTTSTVVLAGSLLSKAEELIAKDVHPTVIVDGYRIASEKAIEILKNASTKVDPTDRQMLGKIARTSMASKLVSVNAEPLSRIVVDAVIAIAEKASDDSNNLRVDADSIKVEKKAGGSIEDTKLIQGIVLDKVVEERKVETDKWVFVEGCKNPKAVSILVRGGSQRVVDEAERSVHDAIMVVKDVLEYPYITVGAGAPEVYISQKIREWSASLSGRSQLAAERFADSIEEIAIALAENAGMDPLDTQTQLRAKAALAKPKYGVDVINGKVANMAAKDIYEPLKVKEQVISAATEASSMILRIDDVIAASKSKESAPPPGGGMGGPNPYMDM